MEIISLIIDFVTHMPDYLNAWSSQMGFWVYVILFLVIFAETGLVIAPLLPGDSLLFALGALAATPGAYFNVYILFVLLFVAAVLGNIVNYYVGELLGRKLVASRKIKFINQQHIDKTHKFFEKYGGKTIVLTRFMPIVRTYAPFVAGLGAMDRKMFMFYNVFGGFAWVTSFLFSGFFFGNIEVVKTNFHIVIAAIIVISFLPPLYEFLRARYEKPVKS